MQETITFENKKYFSINKLSNTKIFKEKYQRKNIRKIVDDFKLDAAKYIFFGSNKNKNVYKSDRSNNHSKIYFEEKYYLNYVSRLLDKKEIIKEKIIFPYPWFDENKKQTILPKLIRNHTIIINDQKINLSMRGKMKKNELFLSVNSIGNYIGDKLFLKKTKLDRITNYVLFSYKNNYQTFFTYAHFENYFSINRNNKTDLLIKYFTDFFSEKEKPKLISSYSYFYLLHIGKVKEVRLLMNIGASISDDFSVCTYGVTNNLQTLIGRIDNEIFSSKNGLSFSQNNLLVELIYFSYIDTSLISEAKKYFVDYLSTIGILHEHENSNNREYFIIDRNNDSKMKMMKSKFFIIEADYCILNKDEVKKKRMKENELRKEEERIEEKRLQFEEKKIRRQKEEELIQEKRLQLEEKKIRRQKEEQYIFS